MILFVRRQPYMNSIHSVVNHRSPPPPPVVSAGEVASSHKGAVYGIQINKIKIRLRLSFTCVMRVHIFRQLASLLAPMSRELRPIIAGRALERPYPPVTITPLGLQAIAWKYGIDGDVQESAIRETEVRNWIRYLQHLA